MPNVMPIEWHESTLVTYEENLRRFEAEVESKVKELERWKKELDFRKLQISEAKRLGKAAFDPDRFLVKRKKG